MTVLASDMIIFGVGVVVWESILAGITFLLLKRKIKKAEREVRAEAARVAAETEAKYTPLFNEWSAALKAHDEQIKRMADWIAEEERSVEEEAEARRREMAERSALGVQTNRDRAELAQMAYEEGSAVIRGPGSVEEKQGKLMALLKAYPDVALTVARRLNRAYRISQSLGISEDALLKIVAQHAAQGLQTAQQIAPQVPDGY